MISKRDVQSVSEEGADMEKRDVRERRAKYEGTGQNIDEFGVPKWLVGCDVGVHQVTPPKMHCGRRAVAVCEWVSLPQRGWVTCADCT